jgi:hypothetical protein
MRNIVIDNVLDAIHYILGRNGFEFSERQIARADDYIIPFMEDLDISEKEFNVITPGAPKLASDRRITPLVVRYFAFIEDNISLYNELVEEQFILSEGNKIKFYALDRIFTKHFRKNEYKNMLEKNSEAISSFYYSIRGLSQEEREKYGKAFSDIVRVDHTTLNVGNDREDGINYYGFLSKNNIDVFGGEFLLKLNKKQRKIINDLHFNLTEEEASKIKELFEKYPDYGSGIPLNSKFLKLFSIDELYSMTVKDYVLYETAIDSNVFKRMREILSIDPLFDCPKGFIKEEIFRVLSNEEIVDLSDEAKEKIARLRIPEMDNVLIMPFSKINGIVLLDKASKKIDSITGNHSK